MPKVHDEEFGEIVVRRSRLSRYVRLKIGQNGSLSASLPWRASVKLVKQLIDQSRDELRGIVRDYSSRRPSYHDGMIIGKSHRLSVVYDNIATPNCTVKDQRIIVTFPVTLSLSSTPAQDYIRESVLKALRKEARAYLPRRTRFLASQHGFHIETIKLNNAKTRWGSCSSKNMLNLNVALMRLPHELIDYVILHELCHTREMNHSEAFWQLVESVDPNYKTHRRMLRTHSPYM